MKKRKAMQLVRALRSGKHKQGKGLLHHRDGKKCCLGVACFLSKTERALGSTFYSYGDDSYADLPDSVMEEFGFENCMGVRRDGKRLLIGKEEYGGLAEANDAGVPFSDIADYIEKNWEAF